ncbi:SMI1/KNR4 family protein [Acinetobacter sp. Ag2]|uniref:SMI1/KNR4 family protein n=1 Tax=Acinetobacter sp. Ag2 TaxID=1646532 RepID=UPI000ACBCA58|nr:SMI1/KNR4 family protein [Acinetobacter sp. Ag2]
MINFVQELAFCRVEGTQIPFFPEKVKGYTEQEIAEIGKNCNLDIHGQFKEFLLQMGKCSGGLLWGDDFPMYSHRWQALSFKNFQVNERKDENYMSCPSSADPVKIKYFIFIQKMSSLFFIIYLQIIKMIIFGDIMKMRIDV